MATAVMWFRRDLRLADTRAEPVPRPADVPWRSLPSDPVPDDPSLDGVSLPTAGEGAVAERLERFLREGVEADAGTDPWPFFRVSDPTTPGERFDPDGAYVRRYVPELAEVPARWIHRPHEAPTGPPAGYPDPIVDHREEREESLRRYRGSR